MSDSHQFAEKNRWLLAPIAVAYALISFAALVLFFDADVSLLGSLDGMEVRALSGQTWVTYMQLHAGFFSLAYIAFLSCSFGLWRRLSWGYLYLASAAAAAATPYLFVTWLRIVLKLFKGPVSLVTSAIFATIIAALWASVVLTATKRLRAEGGIVTSRWTALASSLAFPAFCFVAIFGAALLPWRELNITGLELGYSDYVNLPRAPIVRLYLVLEQPLIMACLETALLLWYVHAIVLAGTLRRWRGLSQRAFVLGSVASAFLTVIFLVAVRVLNLERPAVGPPNELLQILLAIAYLVLAVVGPTFLMFDLLKTRRLRTAVTG